MTDPGYNYWLTDIHAALGHSQLNKLEQFVDERQNFVDRYDQRLTHPAQQLRPITRTPECRVGWHLYPVLIDFEGLGISCAEIIKGLREKGIGTQVHYIPGSSQPYYRRLYGESKLPGARSYYNRTLSLPLFPTMCNEDFDPVVVGLEDVTGTSAK